MSGKNRFIGLLALPFLLMLAVLIVWPLFSIVRDSFIYNGGWSFGNYAVIFQDIFYQQSFINTVGISLLTTVVGMALGFLIAVGLRGHSNATRRVATAFANISANFSGVPLAMAIIFLFGINGMFTLLLKHIGFEQSVNVYSLTGLIIAYGYFQIALGTLLIAPVIHTIPSALEEAATLVGVGPVRFWLWIGLPCIARQLLAITVLLFANAMGTYATTIALTGTSINVVTIRISELISGDVFSDPNLANAIAILLFTILLVPVIGSQIVGEKKE